MVSIHGSSRYVEYSFHCPKCGLELEARCRTCRRLWKEGNELQRRRKRKGIMLDCCKESLKIFDEEDLKFRKKLTLGKGVR